MISIVLHEKKPWFHHFHPLKTACLGFRDVPPVDIDTKNLQHSKGWNPNFIAGQHTHMKGTPMTHKAFITGY